MYSIHSLVKSIFSIHIVKNIPDPPFSRNNYRFFVIFVIILSFDSLGSHKKRICTFINSFVTITAARSNLSHIPKFDILHPVRTVLLDKFFQSTHICSKFPLTVLQIQN